MRYSTARKEVVLRGRELELSGLCYQHHGLLLPQLPEQHDLFVLSKAKLRWTAPFPICGFMGELWVGQHSLPLPVCCREVYSLQGLGGIVYIAETWDGFPMHLLLSVKSRLKYLMGKRFTSFRLYFSQLLQALCSKSPERENGSGEVTCPAKLCIRAFR